MYVVILKIVGEIVNDCTLKKEVANNLSRDFFLNFMFL